MRILLYGMRNSQHLPGQGCWARAPVLHNRCSAGGHIRIKESILMSSPDLGGAWGLMAHGRCELDGSVLTQRSPGAHTLRHLSPHHLTPTKRDERKHQRIEYLLLRILCKTLNQSESSKQDVLGPRSSYTPSWGATPVACCRMRSPSSQHCCWRFEVGPCGRDPG